VVVEAEAGSPVRSPGRGLIPQRQQRRVIAAWGGDPLHQLIQKVVRRKTAQISSFAAEPLETNGQILTAPLYKAVGIEQEEAAFG
jgi:hypothetical protein